MRAGAFAVSCSCGVVPGSFCPWQRALAIAFFIFSPGQTRRTADLNDDGRINVIDSYLLARELEVGDQGRDINADGRIDGADLDELRRRVVHVGEKP